MDKLAAAPALGFALPTPAYLVGALLVGALLFGLIGLAAYRYGGKVGQAQTKWLGLALMLYPYAISATWWL
ncbi:hypothetical protein [Rugamonas sp.]|uniref:hypothetical protein n=1 Tax=Rugamonas sp. TaxID=1926287 RepID=UPI0025DDA85C|nr:hypothetical protein [Rugamonas sp.]